MKKKIKDLTVEEIKAICFSQELHCAGCPFFDYNDRCCRPIVSLIDWNTEVEVPE